ncbi:hypothetical protein JCM16307_02990 [Thermococcus prieurii]
MRYVDVVLMPLDAKTEVMNAMMPGFSKMLSGLPELLWYLNDLEDALLVASRERPCPRWRLLSRTSQRPV